MGKDVGGKRLEIVCGGCGTMRGLGTTFFREASVVAAAVTLVREASVVEVIALTASSNPLAYIICSSVTDLGKMYPLGVGVARVGFWFKNFYNSGDVSFSI